MARKRQPTREDVLALIRALSPDDRLWVESKQIEDPDSLLRMILDGRDGAQREREEWAAFYAWAKRYPEQVALDIKLAELKKLRKTDEWIAAHLGISVDRIRKRRQRAK
jgi:hypothetical protein